MTKQELINQLKDMEQTTIYLSGGQWAFGITRNNNEYTITSYDESYVKADTSEVTYEELVNEFEKYVLEYDENDLNYYTIVLDESELDI